jgi:hypothetical protein
MSPSNSGPTMHAARQTRETVEIPPVGVRDPRETIEIRPVGTDEPSASQAPALSLHDDPQKIHQLLDLLVMPPGTEVRVTTVAASLLVR